MTNQANDNLNDEVSSQVISSIFSGSEYVANSSVILQNLSQRSKSYTNTFLAIMKEVLVNDQYPPEAKFYGLYLLIKSTEQNNDFILSLMSVNKDLLNYLFKAVQYDYKKPIAERGLSFFSKNPSNDQSKIGHNYIILLLEAFQYWNQSYGTSDTKNPLHVYQKMYTSLTKQVKFPERYSYLGRENHVNNDFHLRPAESLQQGNIPQKPTPSEMALGNMENVLEGLEQEDEREKQKSTGKINFNQNFTKSQSAQKPQNNQFNLAKNQVEAYVKSGEERHIFAILESLEGSQAKDYVEAFLIALKDVLEISTITSKEKLNALWLLVKTSERKNAFLIDSLSQQEKLLNLVFQAAQLDYEKQFDKKGLLIFPDSQVIGNKYVNISLEAIKYWAQMYGSSDKNSPRYMFTFMYESLENKMKFPRQNIYIGTNFDTDVMSLGPDVGQRVWEDYEKRTIEAPNEGQTKNTNIRKIEAGFNRLDDAKMQLKGFLESNLQENADMKDLLNYFVLEIEQALKEDVQPYVEPLIGTSNGEKQVTQAFAEGDIINNLTKEYSQFKTKKNTYVDFRGKVLDLLGQPKGFATTSSAKKGIDSTGKNFEDEGFSGNIGNLNNPKRSVKGKAFEEVEKSSVRPIPISGIYQQKEHDIIQNYQRSNDFASMQMNPIQYQRTEFAYANPDAQYSQYPSSSQTYNQGYNQAYNQGVNVSGTKKPAIIGIDTIPLSRKGFSGALDTEEDMMASVNSWEDPYGRNIRMRSPSPTNPQQRDSIGISLIKSYIQSEATKSFLMENKYKWLSHYRFKAGGLMEDKDDPVAQLQQLRSEELQDDNDMPSKLSSPLKEVVEEGRESLGSERMYRLQQEKEKRTFDSESGLRLNTDPTNERFMKESISSIISPVNKKAIGTDLSNIERGIARSSSKVRASELAKIESSLKASFYRSGRNLPTNLGTGIQEMEAREELEREVAKLRQENSRLQRENSFLKIEMQRKETQEDRLEVEELRQMLNNYDTEVTQLKEEISYVKEQNARLNQNYFSNPEDSKNQKLKGGLDGGNESIQLIKRIDEGEVEKRAGSVLGKSIGKRSIFEKVNYDKPQFLITNDVNVLKNDFGSPKTIGFSGVKDQGEQDPKKSFSNKNFISPRHFGSLTERIKSPTRAYDTSMGMSARNETPYNEQLIREIESPYSVTNDIEKAKQGYFLTENDDKVRIAEDSEFDIKGMISSRKDEGQKDIKGKEIKGDASTFAIMKENMKGPISVDDLLRFRVACLKNKCPLYDNDLVQIGIVSTVVHDNSGQRNILKLALYYGNKTKQSIKNFKATVSNAKNVTKLVKPEVLEGVIEPGKQLKQQIAVSFKSTPFECLQIEAELSIEEQPVKFSLYLPSVVTKFMEFKYISAEEFRERWKSNNYTVLKTEQIELDTVVVKSFYDFTKYFAYLVNLTPNDEYDFVQGKKGLELGGVFELDLTNVDYMLKINLLSVDKVVFQVACPEEKTEIAIFLLQTLKLLFHKSERR